MKLDTYFWGGGWDGGGGQKFLIKRLQAVGRTGSVRTSTGRMVMRRPPMDRLAL